MRTDGGIYAAPELNLAIHHTKLDIEFGHGRYGSWKYTFHYRKHNFELIGYDSSYHSAIESDWVTFDQVSYNFLTYTKLTKTVTAINELEEEVYSETWSKLPKKPRILLSNIPDFDAFEFE